MPKERTLKVAAAVFGEEWAERHAKLKRPALAEAVEAAFAGTDPSVDEEGAAACRRVDAAPGSRPSTRGGSATSPAGAAGARGRSQERREEEGGRGEEEGGNGRRRAHGAEVTEARGTAETGPPQAEAGRGTRRAALPPAGRETQRWTNATRATRKPSPAASAATPGG